MHWSFGTSSFKIHVKWTCYERKKNLFWGSFSWLFFQFQCQYPEKSFSVLMRENSIVVWSWHADLKTYGTLSSSWKQHMFEVKFFSSYSSVNLTHKDRSVCRRDQLWCTMVWASTGCVGGRGGSFSLGWWEKGSSGSGRSFDCRFSLGPVSHFADTIDGGLVEFYSALYFQGLW